MDEHARAYLSDALDWIQSNALRRDTLDWAMVRQEALALTGDAAKPSDTYLAIRHVLARLGDRHSQLVEPAVMEQRQRGVARSFGLRLVATEERTAIVLVVLPGGPAEAAGVRAGDVIEAVDGENAIGTGAVAFRALYSGSEQMRLTLRRRATQRPISSRSPPPSTRTTGSLRGVCSTAGLATLSCPNSPPAARSTPATRQPPMT